MKEKEPKWLEEKKKANEPKEEVVFVGKMGVDAVVNGKLPSGEPYLWYKRRPRPKI